MITCLSWHIHNLFRALIAESPKNHLWCQFDGKQVHEMITCGRGCWTVFSGATEIKQTRESTLWTWINSGIQWHSGKEEANWYKYWEGGFYLEVHYRLNSVELFCNTCGKWKNTLVVFSLVWNKASGSCFSQPSNYWIVKHTICCSHALNHSG